MIDGVIQKYDQQMKKIDEVMAKQRAKAIIDAGQEEYQNAVKNQTQAYAELLALEEKYVAAKETLQQRVNELMDMGYSKENALKTARLNMLSEEDQAIIDSYEKKKAEVTGYTQVIADQEALQALYANGSAEAIKQINDSVGQSYRKNGETITLEVQKQIDIEQRKYNDLMTLYKKTGNDTYKTQAEASQKRLKELQGELESSKSTVEKKTPEIVTSWDKMGLLSANAIASKAANFTSAGLKNATAVKTGTEKGKPALETTSKTIASGMVTAFNSKKPEFEKAGKGVEQGIDKGMGDGGSLVSKIGEWAQRMVDKFLDVFDINSPSKVMEKISAHIPEGAERSIEKNKKGAINAMGNMARGMIEKYKDNIKQFDLLDSRELSGKIEAAKGKLNVSMTADQQRIAQAQPANVTFNQYNESPKALDSLEIYRNTQKQLKQLKTWRGYGYV